MLFILAVGGMIAVMSRMGGMQAMALAMAKKAQGSKNVLVMTWLLGLIIFFEDIANSLIVGPTMRPVTDEAKVSREKLSYVIDSTAGPVTDMAPISSWVAHEIGMISLALTTVGMEAANGVRHVPADHSIQILQYFRHRHGYHRRADAAGLRSDVQGGKTGETDRQAL